MNELKEVIPLTDLRIDSYTEGPAWVSYRVIHESLGGQGVASGYSRYLVKGAAYRDLAFKMYPDADVVEFINLDGQVVLKVYK